MCVWRVSYIAVGPAWRCGLNELCFFRPYRISTIVTKVVIDNGNYYKQGRCSLYMSGVNIMNRSCWVEARVVESGN